MQPCIHPLILLLIIIAPPTTGGTKNPLHVIICHLHMVCERLLGLRYAGSLDRLICRCFLCPPRNRLQNLQDKRREETVVRGGSKFVGRQFVGGTISFCPYTCTHMCPYMSRVKSPIGPRTCKRTHYPRQKSYGSWVVCPFASSWARARDTDLATATCMRMRIR